MCRNSADQLIHILECEFALPLAGPVYYPLNLAAGCFAFVDAQSGQQRAADAEDAAVTCVITA